MNRIEHLLESCRPTIEPSREHCARLRGQLRERYGSSAGWSFFSRRPDFAVLFLGAGASFICWTLSLALGALSACPQPLHPNEIESVVAPIEHVVTRPKIALADYAGMLLPRPESIDFEAMRQGVDSLRNDRRISGLETGKEE